jgi:hypothetical protein
MGTVRRYPSGGCGHPPAPHPHCVWRVTANGVVDLYVWGPMFGAEPMGICVAPRRGVAGIPPKTPHPHYVKRTNGYRRRHSGRRPPLSGEGPAKAGARGGRREPKGPPKT